MKYDKEYHKKLDEEFDPTLCSEGALADPRNTVIAKAYMRLVNTVSDALLLMREEKFYAADSLLQYGLLAAEEMLIECNHPLDAYIK